MCPSARSEGKVTEKYAVLQDGAKDTGGERRALAAAVRLKWLLLISPSADLRGGGLGVEGGGGMKREKE